jgi:hypothetical protein
MAAHNHQHGGKTAETVEVKRTATDSETHKTPCTEHANHVDCVLAHCEGVRSRFGETSLLKEVGGVTAEAVSAQVLHGPAQADDLCAAQVDALEAVHVRASGGDLAFERSSVDNHGNRLVGIEVGLPFHRRKTKERLLGLFDAALSHKPPGALRSEEDTGDERDRPHPLQSVGNTVGPLILSAGHSLDDSNGNELSKSPAEVDVGGKISSESYRADFGGVSDGQSLEDTPLLRLSVL